MITISKHLPSDGSAERRGKDQQGEEEKGLINEGNRLIIDLFQCMFAHGSLISVNKSKQ